MARSKYPARSREQILADAKAAGVHFSHNDTVVWTRCWNCGGSGTYPSAMIPPGMCRLYCWQDRTPETYGKLPHPVDKYVRAEQANDRREAKWEAERGEREARIAAQQAEREARKESLSRTEPLFLNACVLYDLDLDDLGTYSGRRDHDFVQELIGKWLQYGELSDAQMAALRRAVDAEQARRVRTHVGEIGERRSFNVSVSKLIEIERRNRYSYSKEYLKIVKMVDDGGHALVWFTTSWPDLQEGDGAEIVGTIKEHSEYNGEKQTVLQRVTVKSVLHHATTEEGN
jgi:hypothetical protein